MLNGGLAANLAEVEQGRLIQLTLLFRVTKGALVRRAALVSTIELEYGWEVCRLLKGAWQALTREAEGSAAMPMY